MYKIHEKTPIWEEGMEGTLCFVSVCMSVPKVALILVLASGQKKYFHRTCKKYRPLSSPSVGLI